MHRHALLVALAAASSPAMAASLSSNVTATSDYLFDGISQTGGRPALQLGLDASWESGFYLGAWGSNVDFGAGDGTDAELNFYGGYVWELSEGLSLDAGLLRFHYVGAPAAADYTEAYIGLNLPSGTGLRAWFADDAALGGRAWRAKATHSFDLGGDFSLDLVATRVHFSSAGAESFWHGQAGVSHPLGPFTAYLGYSDTSLDDNPRADGRVLFSLSLAVD